MKLKNFLAIAALLGFSSAASAQFTSAMMQTNLPQTANPEKSDSDPQSVRYFVSYENHRLSANEYLNRGGGFFNGEDAITLNGVGIGMDMAFRPNKNIPLALGGGLKFHYAYGKIENSTQFLKMPVEIDGMLREIAMGIPLNIFSYINIGENVALEPYVGINFKINFMAESKTEYKFKNKKDQDLFDKYNKEDDKWVDYYKKDDVGKDNKWNVFQMGWQIGAGLKIHKLYLGLQYGTDFIPTFKNKEAQINSGTFSVKLGYNLY